MTPTRVCGAIDCDADARYVIQHREHGRRVVCSEHIDEHPVIELVG